jgi:type IV pilus assembly protein PilQ
MIMSPKCLLAAVAVIAMGTSSQRAEANNEVRAVTFTEDAGTTLVHVRGEQTPTFTVYKLERPSRVVIDMPQARLSEALRGHESASVLTPNTWAVSTIAAQQLDDGGTRVIVSLARPGRYDVKTEGNEVVIMVMPRDAAPKTANPAELEQAKAQAQAAEQEAARLRTLAAEQAARAESAQKTVEEAKKLSAKDLQRAKQLAAAANAEAARAKTEAAKAQIAADRARTAALAEAAQAKAQRDTATAQRDAATAEAGAAKAQAEEAMKKLEAAQAAAEMAKREADAAKREAMTAKSEAAKAQNNDTKKKLEAAQRAAETAQREAESAKREALAAKTEMAKANAIAAQAQAQAQTAMTNAQNAKSETMKANAVAMRAQSEAQNAKSEAQTAMTQAQTAMTDAQNAKAEAARIKQAAEAMRAQADAERLAATNDKQAAEAARSKAEKLMRDAKVQLAQLDAKSAAAQALEDKARTTLAAAQAREEAARDSAAQAQKERQIAEAAAKTAQAAASKSAAADRAKLVADAEAAEARLAKAKRSMEDAEARRMAAEQAASTAKRDLDEQRTALATVEQQRTTAVTAASDAARKRSEAEAAAFDATKKKADAERAAKDADSRRTAAELAAKHADSKRASAELAAKEADKQRTIAEDAAKAAEKQRTVAENAAKSALTAKRDAEASLAALTAKRVSAEKAAQDLTARTKAEAKAQADMIAAQSRKASDNEIAAAKREVARLADERKHAETELADRRKAVAQQQAEATRLETVAAQARDAATREESRKTQLAEQRAAEEQELARLKAQKAAALVAAQVKQQPVQAQLAQVQTRSQSPVKTPNAKVSNVTFKGNDTAGTVELAVSGDANITLGDVTASHVELIVDHADLATKLERTLDVSKFGSPVKKVSTYRDRRTPDRVRLVAELTSPAIPTVVRNGNTVRWRFASHDVAMRTQNIKPTVIGGFGAASTPVAQQSVSQVPPTPGARGRRIYHGATVDFDFKDAPIHDLLRVLADTGNVNIVVPDTIDAKVTVRLKRVPWDQALEVILASHGLWYRREGNLYRIASRKEIDAEDEAEAARRAASVAAEAPRPEVVTLNYASADELKPKLEQMLSPKGRIEVDGRTNSLIINDVSGSRDQIARLARSLDTQTPQITIEARIVEARSTFIRQFGIQWGGRALAGAAGGNATGLVFPSSIGIVGGNSDQQTNANGITALPSDFAINLPAATGAGEGGAIGMSLGSVGGNFNINLRLSALEDSGTVRIISAPKITVLNNKAALIRQGVSIPISVVSAAGTNTQFVQADLSLEVTPYVSQQDCAIAMNINVTKNEPDFVNVGARGDPTILRKEAKTTMLVNDGETSVLGGIYTRNSGLSYRKVPFLGDLPVLGWLFKNRRENDDRTEILVFITPKITNKASLRCQQ